MPSYKDLQDKNIGTADTLPPANSTYPLEKNLSANQSTTTGARIAALGRQIFAAISATLKTADRKPRATTGPTMPAPATVQRANRESNDAQQFIKSINGLVVNRGYKKALELLLSDQQKSSQLYEEIINYLYPEASDTASNEPKKELVTLILQDWLEYTQTHNSLNYRIFAATKMLDTYNFNPARNVLTEAQILQYNQAVESKAHGLAVAAASWLEKNHPELNISVEATIASQLKNETNPDVILKIARIQADFEVKDWENHLTNAIKIKYERLKANQQYRAAYEFIQKNRDELPTKEAKNLLLESRVNFIKESILKGDYESAVDLSMEVLHSHPEKKADKEFRETLSLALQQALQRAIENNNKLKINHYSLLANSLKLT